MKNVIGHLMGIVLNIKITFSNKPISTILILLIHEHGSFSVFYFILQYFIFFIVEFFHLLS
jgi:hypothetical protein